MSDRLFVLLSYEAFDSFLSGEKTYEFRSSDSHYNSQKVWKGRGVELRRGYTQTKAFGIIGEVFVGSPEEIYSKIPFRKIEPKARIIEEAIRESVSCLTNQDGPFIAFEIMLSEPAQAAYKLI